MSPYPHWRIRRTIIIMTLLFCAGCVAFIMLRNTGNELDQAIVYSAFGLASAVIASYVFGAVWEDNATRSTGGWEAAPALGAPPPNRWPGDPASGVGPGG